MYIHYLLTNIQNTAKPNRAATPRPDFFKKTTQDKKKELRIPRPYGLPRLLLIPSSRALKSSAGISGTSGFSPHRIYIRARIFVTCGSPLPGGCLDWQNFRARQSHCQRAYLFPFFDATYVGGVYAALTLLFLRAWTYTNVCIVRRRRRAGLDLPQTLSKTRASNYWLLKCGVEGDR